MKKVILALSLLFLWGNLFDSGNLGLAGKKTDLQPPVASWPDLAIGELVLNKNKFIPGEPIEARVQISQNSEKDLAGVKVRLLLDRKPLAGDQVLSIKARGFQEVRFSFKADSPGVHELTALVDPDNALKEVNKGNNQATRRFEVAAPSAAATPPMAMTAGQPGPAPPPGAGPVKAPVLGPAVDRGPNPSKESPFPRLQEKPKERQVVDTTARVVGPPPDPTDIRLTYFAVNFGAAETTVREVTLNYRYTGSPNHFEASEFPDFGNARFGGPERLHSMPFTLSYGAGSKTVYFRAGYGTSSGVKYSNILSDSIEFRPPAPRYDYTVPAGEFYESTKDRGFSSSSIPLGFMSSCNIYPLGSGSLMVIAAAGRGIGSSCNFTLFDGTLKEGWQFKSYTERVECSPPKRGYSVDEKPTEGSSTPRFRLHLWADPTGNLLGEPSHNECTYYLDTITLSGPPSVTWRHALP